MSVMNHAIVMTTRAREYRTCMSFPPSSVAGAPFVSATVVTRRGPQSKQRGVGLIEVLVAVLILSIAFLGVAALQAMSLSTNNTAMARSMATISSYSILDAMRADLTNATALSYNTATPLKANACPDAGATLATYQLNQWCNQLGKNLGVAATTTGAIACTATGDCTITISFDDSRASAGSKQTVVTRAML